MRTFEYRQMSTIQSDATIVKIPRKPLGSIKNNQCLTFQQVISQSDSFFRVFYYSKFWLTFSGNFFHRKKKFYTKCFRCRHQQT